MPQPFSPERKKHALQVLDSNFGDVQRTSRELGISDRTLYKWRKNAGLQFSPPPPTSPTLDFPPHYEVGRGLGGGDNLPADDLQALLDLKAEMVRAAKYIAVNIIAAVEAAPLGQRVTALAQLIDRISKLAAQLPAAEDEEIIVYEKRDTYAEENSAENTAFETVDDFGM